MVGTDTSFNVTFQQVHKPLFYAFSGRDLELDFPQLTRCDPAYAHKLRERLEQTGFLKASDPQKNPRISFVALGPRVNEFVQVIQQSLDS